MQKTLLFLSLAASLIMHGCSTINRPANDANQAGSHVPDNGSWIYQPMILQGNIVTQAQVNRLKPGMPRRQVRFILGTPTLQDVFHANRWDYHYTKGLGSEPNEIKRLTVYFDEDALSYIDGDVKIQPKVEREPTKRMTVVKVPDLEKEESFF